MTILDVSFEWPVAVAGYTLREHVRAPAPAPAYERPASFFFSLPDRPVEGTILSGIAGDWVEIVPRSEETRQTFPLALNRELYLRFSELEDQPQAFVDFATAWGLLTADGPKRGYERIDTWSRSLNFFKSAVERAEIDPFWVAEMDVRPRLDARLVRAAGLRPELRFTPHSLIHALWLQFFVAVALGTEIKNCARCGRWFERGPGTSRGRKARFCSDACRFGFHNERRSKGETP